MGGKNSKSVRSSNIELLRIVLMLIVIAHHCVVNSNIQENYNLYVFSWKRVFFQVFGCGGKISINAFLIITGYFMCRSVPTRIKWVKLLLQCIFYNVIINSCFLLAGYTPLGKKTLFWGFVPIIRGLGTGKDVFMTLFLVLYLLIPFLNKTIQNMSPKEFKYLLSVLLFVYTVVGSLYIFQSENGTWQSVNHWEGIGWYCTVYLIGAYIRMHCPKRIDSLKSGLILTIVSWVLVIGSIIGLDIISLNHNFLGAYFFVYGGNKILAILTAISMFLLFKNIKMKHYPLVNTVSSATYGVLLIHGNNDTMRKLIWYDLFKVGDYYSVNILTAVLHTVGTVVIIYVVCVIIELIRQYTVEKFIMKQLEQIEFLKKSL